MKDARKIIIEPIITEKALRLKDSANQYVFKVDGSSNKIELARAIKIRFNVTVDSLRTVNVKGKKRQRMVRGGRIEGYTARYKKAYVTLIEGDTLDFLENV